MHQPRPEEPWVRFSLHDLIGFMEPI